MAWLEARANARMGLMLAIGELQKEMGPDMRVSTSAAIFDQVPETVTIDGVAQPNWLASYDSWGSWLNDSYQSPTTGKTLRIQETYTPKRNEMFRKWLLSLPDGASGNVDAPMSLSGWDSSNSVILVGKGSLGDAADTNPEQVTRAYLQKVGQSGCSAWWVGSENQKARIDLAKQPRVLSIEGWETAHGDTAEVGVGVLTGLEDLDSDAELGDKLFTLNSLAPAGIQADVVGKHFFDLTASSKGVLASVRTGHLKKDISLLFEKPKAQLPDLYRFDVGAVREPSIRPMSPEIAGRAVLPNRHFASWTRMRHFYRMYRQDSDAVAPAYTDGGLDGGPALDWSGSKPSADCNLNHFNANTGEMFWNNQDTYVRFPILTNATYILSLKTQIIGAGPSRNLHCLSTPVYVFWNPYNVELVVPNSRLWVDVDFTTLQPLLGRLIRNSVPENGKLLLFSQDRAGMKDDNEAEIRFKPGEFRIFTAEPGVVNPLIGTFVPGFNPLALGGMVFSLGTSTGSDNPKLGINFSPVSQSGRLFNSQFGNNPGSFFTKMSWEETVGSSNNTKLLPFHCHVDWLDESAGQAFAPITRAGFEQGWIFDDQPFPIGFVQLALKSNYGGSVNGWYDTIGWEQDWRCRNWIQAPPFYLGKGLYLSSSDPVMAHTQRMDCPYEFRFGSLLGKEPADIIHHYNDSAFLSEHESVTAVPCLELPSAPIGSLAGFSGMRIEPGWTNINTIHPDWQVPRKGNGVVDTTGNTLQFATSKVLAYQSGITGPGIGNSFLHPIIPRTDIYRKFDNSKGSEPTNFQAVPSPAGLPYPYSYTGYSNTDNKAYCDYWDHVLLLNDALWDDYFVSSIADQTRGDTSVGDSLTENLTKFVKGEGLANSRYMLYTGGRTKDELVAELEDVDGYLKAASCLMVDGAFNVNSTSVEAWNALFAGIRERDVVYRDKDGTLRRVDIPSNKRIALSRFNTATTDQEMTDPEDGVERDDGMKAWSGVRFLDDDQLRKLAEKCVEQVKRRGPFLNFSEFINRRLSNDDLGVMGALQSAIDYDDASPEAGSINYDFKSQSDFMIEAGDLGSNSYATPEAATGSRYAGIPGYVIQSDLLKPIANTLTVRDDTFLIRAYGDARDKNDKILARVWCEAIVQRIPDYVDPTNKPEVAARTMSPDGLFSSIDTSELTLINRKFGRKFEVVSFRWLDSSEI